MQGFFFLGVLDELTMTLHDLEQHACARVWLFFVCCLVSVVLRCFWKEHHHLVQECCEDHLVCDGRKDQKVTVFRLPKIVAVLPSSRAGHEVVKAAGCPLLLDWPAVEMLQQRGQTSQQQQVSAAFLGMNILRLSKQERPVQPDWTYALQGEHLRTGPVQLDLSGNNDLPEDVWALLLASKFVSLREVPALHLQEWHLDNLLLARTQLRCTFGQWWHMRRHASARTECTNAGVDASANVTGKVWTSVLNHQHVYLCIDMHTRMFLHACIH